MVFETARERRRWAEAWGDYMLLSDGTRIDGQYQELQAEELLVEGRAPDFLALTEDLEAAGVTIGTDVPTVQTYWGGTRGPFRVVRWQTINDGANVNLGLEQR